ncbi:MAG: isoleucine--tRNA ligase [gamma proteobacterium endosymbiont of Trioza apicalis]
MINYKNTLNLPYTKFPMRGNLTISEPKILQRWYKNNLYEKIKLKKKNKTKFILHDGPPYANGDIHIGHAVNKILKDIIIKSKNLMNYDVSYVPGWDCHGLPIELNVEKLIYKFKKKINNKIFRYICRYYAKKQILKQKRDFIRLGVLGDWKNSYLTMNYKTEANIIRSFSKVISNGYLYKGIKPVHWCLDCCSALAETEVEYNDHISLSLYFIFNVIDNNKIEKIFKINKFEGKISFIIWTTTLWTLPSNRAVVIHPDFDYQLIKIDNQCYILASNLVKKIMSLLSISKWINLGIVKGKFLEFIKLNHPFMNYDVPVILGKYVTLDIGTGVVHISPCHGIDDYVISKKYGLKFFDPIGPNGKYHINTLNSLDGLHIFNVDKIIINLLVNSNSLLHTLKIKHSYPYCWRHKTPIIFRSTSQWFISMDKYNLRKKLLLEIENVNWIPKWGKDRIKIMINNRLDWCVSRQRIWGVPMAFFVHKKTKKLHPNTVELMELIAQRVEIYGIQAWWDLNLTDILGDDAKYYKKVNDTLDVWFDSGSTFFSIITKDLKLKKFKSNIYLEGHDQYRGWFLSSLIISTIINNNSPYNEVLTHGFVVDGHGFKMSKSLGNIIKPKEIINKLGSDILRLCIASSNYTNDMSICNKILNHSIEYYRRIRNTARFLLANLNDFNPDKHIVHSDNMLLLDRWAVNRAYLSQIEIINEYNNYNFNKIIKIIMNFCSLEMGSVYLDIIKDRQYTTKKNSIARRSCQTALYHNIEALVRWLAPIIPFTADEIWRYIPGNRSKFVFTETWYDGLFKIDNSKFLNDNYFKILFKIRNESNKIIEKARLDKKIFSSLEAHIKLYAEPVLANKLKKLEKELHFIFLTSKVEIFNFIDAEDDALTCKTINGLKIKLLNAKGKKCSRCWHYENDIGLNNVYKEICGRCIINIIGIGENRKFI